MRVRNLAVCLVLVGWVLISPALGATLEELKGLMAQAEFGQAIEQGNALLAGLQADQPDGSAEIADLLDVLVESRWRSGMGLDPETRQLGLRSLEMKRRLLGPADAGVGKTLHHLAILSYFHGEYGKAGDLWEEAIAIRRSALGDKHPDVAESTNGLANLYQVTGEFGAARKLYESTLEIRRATLGPEDPRVGHTLNNLGALLLTMGEYAAALDIAEQSLEIKRKAYGEDHVELAVGYLSLGQILDESGDYERAKENTEKAVKIWEDSLGPDNPDIAPALNNLAEQHRRRNQFKEARPLYERVLAIWEKADPEHSDVGLVLSNLGQTLSSLGELEEARKLLKRSVANREKALGAAHHDVATSLHHLGNVLSRLGRDEAGEVFERSLSIRRDTYGVDHPTVAEGLTGLSLVHARRGERGAALREAIEAERIARDHLRLTGRTLAEEHALRYAIARDSGLDLALTLATERQDETAVGDVLDAVIRSRAVVLDEMAARNRSITSSTDPEVARLAERLAAARARLANLTVRGLGRLDVETYRRLVDEARDGKEKAERALGAASADFARQQQLSRLGLSEVRSRLPAGSALVSYVIYDHLDLSAPEADASEGWRPETPRTSYGAIILFKGAEPRAVRLGEAKRIDAVVAGWKKEAAKGATDIRRTGEKAVQDYRKIGQELRETVWDPVSATLEDDIQRVFIVPDGSLNLVTLASLPDGEQEYLVETGPTLHYVSAERDLVRADDEGSGHGMLAIGGPDYDATDLFGSLSKEPVTTASTGDPIDPETTTRGAACSSFQSLKFEPLPAAAEETRKVAAYWSKSLKGKAAPEDRGVELTGSAASEKAFKEASVGRRLLHIATHGFFLGGDCAGGEGTRGFKIVEEKKEEPVLNKPVSPLLLSGLAMAGANHRSSAAADEEDGVLTAEEIAGLDLSGVEWAVLSACDTGVGEIQAGEGVFGLRRAMQVAGVQTLIMSLWPVDDEATRQWMNALYHGRLNQELDSAAAVRNAARTVLKNRREAGESTHPFYWAAFVGAGDWH